LFPCGVLLWAQESNLQVEAACAINISRRVVSFHRDAVVFRELSGFCGYLQGLSPILCRGRALCVDWFATGDFPSFSNPSQGWTPSQVLMGGAKFTAT
jgi:hypothetical protein